MLRDGVYELAFWSEAGACMAAEFREQGEGLAVLRAGRIFGSDKWGAVFRGGYQFDAEKNTNRLDLTVELPPRAELLTGATVGVEGAQISTSCYIATPDPCAMGCFDLDGHALAIELRYVGALPT